MEDNDWFRWQDGALVLRLRIQPKASRDEFTGPQEGRLRIRITAPPVDGKANLHLIRFLAKAFGVSKSSVTIEAGESSRDKRVRITGPVKSPIADLNLPAASSS